MAILTEPDRAAIALDYQRERSALRIVIPVNKTDLRAAIDAADDWVDSNSASFNTALPAAFKSAATAKEKAALLMYVVQRRFKVL